MSPMCMYEGRCWWCALLHVQRYVTFAYLHHVHTPTNKFDTWSGA